MNCQEIRNAIVIEPTDRPSTAHLLNCSSCRQYAAEMSSLRALLRQQPRVEVPSDYDFRLRARIARAESDRRLAPTSVFSSAGRGFWQTVTEWISNGPLHLALDLRGGVTAAVALATLVVGLSIYRSSEDPTPTLPTSNVATLAPLAKRTLSSPNTHQEATVAVAASPRSSRSLRSRAATIPASIDASLTLAAIESVAVDGAATRSDLPMETAWRVYNAERREMISSSQQMTYLGAESSPRLTRPGLKEVGFIPSI